MFVEPSCHLEPILFLHYPLRHPGDAYRNPELDSVPMFVQPSRRLEPILFLRLQLSGGLIKQEGCIQRFYFYVCNWWAGMLASESVTQHNGMPSPLFRSTPGRAYAHFVPLQ